MTNQKHLFSLNEEYTYLNGAYMSPQLKTVEQIGIENLKRKSQPYLIKDTDFFSEKRVLRNRFATLIKCHDPQRISIIPSVSFGMATAIKNIEFNEGDEIVVLEEQFPSNFYAWKQLEKDKKIVVKTIKSPTTKEGRGKEWNHRVLQAISSKTKCVSLPIVHWTDGTIFDIKTIRQKTNEYNAYLIIDGTQSIGALPFSVTELNPDALICAGYKWLMGPYSIGLAYFGSRFDYGIPLDNNWMNHEGSEDFANLVNYNPNFQPKAMRYDVGESSNFILVPMMSEALNKLNEWTPEVIQDYCKKITEPGISKLIEAGHFIEDLDQRASHIFGIYLKDPSKIDQIKAKLLEEKILVSYRGKAIRVSPNIYNSETEFEKFVSCFLS